MKSLRSSSEQALKYVEKASRIKIADLRDNPGARVAGRVLRASMNQGGHTIGELQRAAKPPLGWIWGDFFRPWHRMFPGDEHFNGDINLRREYPPLSLLELQRLIDLGYLDTSKLIDLSALCGTKKFQCNPSQRQFGVQLTDEGAGLFKSKVNLEVQWASVSAIAAIEKAGGKIRTAYYDLESLRAACDPKAWFLSGKPVPPRKAPPHQLVSYYLLLLFRYLAEPTKIAESEQRLAELVGYERSAESGDLEEKARDQVFLGIPSGSLVSLADRKVFYPTTATVEEYYKQQLIADHSR
uniref:Large ribosomal subunit protein uL15m n=1 Tax=Steinernema glaseri TaxID=37863 RepID=A0A1I8AEL2_9BILA